MQLLRYACRGLARGGGRGGRGVHAQIYDLDVRSGEISSWVWFRDAADYRAQSRSFEGIAMYRLAMPAASDGARPNRCTGYRRRRTWRRCGVCLRRPERVE